MKRNTALLCASICALPGLSLLAQDENQAPPVPPVVAPPSANDLPALPSVPLPPPALEPTDLPGDPAAAELPPVEPVTPPREPLAPPITPAGIPALDVNDPNAPEQAIQESDEGYMIKDAALNDIFQFLAKQAGRQYFHNVKISTPDYQVTGHLNDGDPLQQMEELAFMYGLMLYTKGSTVYALTQAQLSQLPSTEFTYRLRYLRPKDIDQIKDLLKPILSPGTGIINFEPKTNTIIIIDTAHRIEQAREVLHKIDVSMGQIIIETKIMRVKSKAYEGVGVDWSGSLGKNGVDLGLTRDLNSIFGLPSSLASSIPFANGTNLVLSPVQIDGVLRALAEGGLATQISNPTLITEDNEQGIISIIDRVPIITSTTNASGGGDISSVSEEVRYKIDESDPTITEDPEKSREIGITMVVSPTLLPDGTIRMRLRPRTAQIVEEIKSAATGNVYPRVNEAMIESISRVPNGFSLVIGGFYGESEITNDNKVPLLGDIPILNFFFKSKQTLKEQTSLVFIVTPTSYDPTSRSQTGRLSNELQNSMSLTRDFDWVDPTCNPGPAHEPNLRRGLRGLRPKQAPYYPTEQELQRQQTSTPQPVSTSASRRSFNRGRR